MFWFIYDAYLQNMLRPTK